MGTGIALSHQTDIGYIGGSKVATGVHIHQMVALFISAAANIMHLHHALVDYDDNFFGVQPYGAHVTAHGACLSQHFRLSHFHLGYAHSVHDLNLIHLVVAAYKAQDKTLFALEGHCLHGFFHRQLQILANVRNGLTVRSEHLFHSLSFLFGSFDQVQLGLFNIGCVLALRAVHDFGLATVGQHHELMAAVAADSAAIGLNGAIGQAAAVENAAISVVHFLVGFI